MLNYFTIQQQLEENLIPKPSSMTESTPTKLNNNQNESQKMQFVPEVSFDPINFQIRINGEQVDYEKLTLTNKGLQIPNTYGSQPQNLKIMVDLTASIQFDTKLNENKYCMQLARSIDRASNAQFHRHLKSNKNNNSQKSSHQHQRMEICEFLMKKIPLKSRCFQHVFRHISIQKIKFMFQNDMFFQEVAKFIFKSIFKANINRIIDEEQANFKCEKRIYQHLTSQDDKINQQSPQYIIKTQKQQRNKCSLNKFQRKIKQLYQKTIEQTKIHKLCFERINLLLSVFTQQTRLSNFLYQLNRQLINLQLKQELKKMLRTDNQFEATSNKDNIFQTISSLISIIKTVAVSAGKSSVSYSVLKQHLIQKQILISWLEHHLQTISQGCVLSNILIQLLAKICQFACSFVAHLYSLHQPVFHKLLKSQVEWIYITLHYQFASEDQKVTKRNYAYTILDALMLILQTTIKQTISSINIGRVICKLICDTATNLREKDIHILTYACCINKYSRQSLLKYLFGYFRKFIKSVRLSLKGPKSISVINAKKNKHKVLQIMQSIRKISEIEQLQLSIDEQLVADIEMILDTAKLRNRQQNGRQRVNCMKSIYISMTKNVKIQKTTKQKDTQDSLQSYSQSYKP